MTSIIERTIESIHEMKSVTEQDTFVHKDIEYFDLIVEEDDKFYSVGAARCNYEGTTYGDGANPHDSNPMDTLVKLVEVFYAPKTVDWYA